MSIWNCANCGSGVFEDSGDYRVCKYCGSMYPLKFRVKVDGIDSFDDLMQRGDTFIMQKDFDKAFNVFDTVMNTYPQAVVGYVKAIQSLTHMFSKDLTNIYPDNYVSHQFAIKELLGKIEELKQKLDITAKPEEKAGFSSFYEQYEDYNAFLKKEIGNFVFQNEIRDLNNTINIERNNRDNFETQLEREYKTLTLMKNRSSIEKRIIIASVLIGFLPLIIMAIRGYIQNQWVWGIIEGFLIGAGAGALLETIIIPSKPSKKKEQQMKENGIYPGFFTKKYLLDTQKRVKNLNTSINNCNSEISEFENRIAELNSQMIH